MQWFAYITSYGGIVREISNEIAKKIRHREILSGKLKQWAEKIGFGNRQQYNNTQGTVKARQIKLVDEALFLESFVDKRGCFSNELPD